VGDEVEFTVIQDPDSSFSNTKHSAIRIKHLPEGSVQFETLIQSNVEGLVTREAPKSPIKSQERTEGGVITYEEPDGGKKTIMYFLKDCDKAPRVGDKIRFNICQVRGRGLFFCIYGSYNWWIFVLTGQTQQGTDCDQHPGNLPNE
jgi:hypothetical protein